MAEGDQNASMGESGRQIAQEEGRLVGTQKKSDGGGTRANHRKPYGGQPVRQFGSMRGERPEPYYDEES